MARSPLSRRLLPLVLAAALAPACAAGFVQQEAVVGGGEGAGDGGPPSGSSIGGSTDTPTSGSTPKVPIAGSTPADPGDKTGAAAPADSCLPLTTYFSQVLWTPILQVKCKSCHAAQVVPGFPLDGDEAAALKAATTLAVAPADGSGPLLVAKPTGRVMHGGGPLLAADSNEAKSLQAFADAVGAGKTCATAPAP